ncbi:MAG TPA: PAN domain-containing protein [Waterburya sp.]|jgi:hypothetical protein
MKAKLLVIWTRLRSVSPKKVLVFLGAALLLALGFSFLGNFTPLVEPVTAQSGPFPTNIQRYAVTAEIGRDRAGSDFSRFLVSSASSCQEACVNNSGCAAYTYVRPGVQDIQGVCYLKSPAPVSTSNSCCISGVKI